MEPPLIPKAKCGSNINNAVNYKENENLVRKYSMSFVLRVKLVPGCPEQGRYDPHQAQGDGGESESVSLLQKTDDIP